MNQGKYFPAFRVSNQQNENQYICILNINFKSSISRLILLENFLLAVREWPFGDQGLVTRV